MTKRILVVDYEADFSELLHCEKDAEAIKECIRRNERVSITLYRGERTLPQAEVIARALEQPRLPFGRSRAGTERLAAAPLTIPAPP